MESGIAAQAADMRRLKDLSNWPRNYRKGDVDAIAKSIEQYGFNGAVRVKGATVYAGNHAIKALRRLEDSGAKPPAHVTVDASGDWWIRVIPIDHLSEEEATAFAIADNRTQELGEYDEDALAALLVDLNADPTDHLFTGYSEEETASILNAQEEGSEKLDFAGKDLDDFEVDESRKPICKPGDVWRLGNHRLLCGDCTDSDLVSGLFEGKKFDMFLSDPPYGVSYVGKTADALTIQNDSLKGEAMERFIDRFTSIAIENGRDGSCWYQTIPPGPDCISFIMVDWNRRGLLRQILVWKKDSMVLGHSEYHYKHEFILFGWMPGKRHKNQDRTRTSVWDVPRPKRSEEHPTMKPVELWQMAIRDGSRKGEIVYDPFVGSGTSIIASEIEQRVCFACELNPVYADVAIRRWQELTGQSAVHAESGSVFGAEK